MKLQGPIRHRSSDAVIHSGEGSLYKENLAHADLRGADLSRVKLGCAHLEHADLRDADLSNADLACASLKGADLRGATLDSANLLATRLDGADLRRASMRWARLRETQFADARLEGADLRNARFLFDDGQAYWAKVRTSQLVRSQLSGKAESFVRHCHRWRFRWLAVRWWAAAALILTLIAWYTLRAVG